MQFSRAHLGAAAAIMFAASLAGCNDNGGRLALTGQSYCTPFRNTSNTSNTSNQNNQSGLAAPAANPADPATAFDDCLHRWAYAMAPARDPADIVAHAAVDACGQAMNAWNQQASAAQNGAGQDQGLQQGAQPGYGPPPNGGRGGVSDQQMQMQQAQNNPIAQHMQIAESRALFYVIQARAAGCAPPPPKSLVSTPAA